MLKLLILIVITLLILSFFGISIRSIATSPVATDNFNYVWQWVVTSFNFILTGIQNLIGTLSTDLGHIPVHF
jgi:hypothetical protein